MNFFAVYTVTILSKTPGQNRTKLREFAQKVDEILDYSGKNLLSRSAVWIDSKIGFIIRRSAVQVRPSPPNQKVNGEWPDRIVAGLRDQRLFLHSRQGTSQRSEGDPV